MGPRMKQSAWFNPSVKGEKAPGDWVVQEKEDEDVPKMILMYKFYKQPMRNPITILTRSDMPENLKVTTLSRELQRRLKNTSIYVYQQTQEEILGELM